MQADRLDQEPDRPIAFYVHATRWLAAADGCAAGANTGGTRGDGIVRRQPEVRSVLPSATLKQLVTHLPNDKTQLRLIHGIGKVRLRRYAKELCRLIQEHRAEQRKNKGQTSEAERKRVRGPSAPSETKCRSFELFQSGKSVDEIAAERQLAPGTIEGHLAHFIRLSELDVDAVLDPESVDAIQQFLTAHPDTGVAKAKAHFGDKYSYGKLKMVMSHVLGNEERVLRHET